MPRRPPMSKRQRRELAEARGTGAGSSAASVADAVEAELRRNKISSRINYDIVNILSQTLDEDMERMPNAPGPVGSLADMGARGMEFSEALRWDGSRSSRGGDRDDAASLVASSHGEEPTY